MIIVRTLAVGILAILSLSVVRAQEAAPDDDVLQRYALATENLGVAVDTLQDDAAASRNALDQAFSALLTLSRRSSSTLTESLDRVFSRARTAIDNRSPTDLAVQTAVLRGGFQRLLYESALSAAVAGDGEVARARLLRLARDLGLGEARLAQVETLAEAGPLRRVLEAGVAEQVGARLTTLAEQAPPSDRDQAYLALADAYGAYLLVQDSPRVNPESNARFVDAAGALVDGDYETYQAALSGLGADLSDLRTAADEGVTADPDEDGDAAAAELPSGAQDPEPPADDTPSPQEGAEPAAEDQAAEDQATEDQATAEQAEPDEAADVPEETQAQAPGEGEDAAAETLPGDAEADPDVRARIVAELEAERAAAERRALDQELGPFALDPDTRSRLVIELHDAGVDSVEDTEQDLGALASRFTAHVLRGQPLEARARLRELEARYRTRLRPLATEAAPNADARLMDLFSRLDQAPSLRSADAMLLSSEVESVSDELRGGTATTSHELVDTASSAWAGLVRPVAMIVLALLALVPLRLLDLAFGGANRNWRLIGTALLLLFIPIYYEGIAAAAALLAGPLGVPALASLTAWSVFQNDLTQMVWAALTLLALLLATGGLYGICVQFGVLGRKAGRAPARAATESGDDTLVDWEDDF